MPLQLQLFLTFARIGLFTFGGGYAMISLIEHTCVEQKKWMTHEEMMDMTVIAESTPGPIAINCATFVGWKQGGIPGSIVATFGMVLPSFVIIYLISSVLDNFLQIPLIAHAFQGIRIGVGLLILSVALNMVKKMAKKPRPRIIAACACAVMLVINFTAAKVSSIALLVIAGAVSWLIYMVSRRKKGGA